MDMIHMLGVLAIVFFTALTLMCIYRNKLNNPIVNPLLISACAVFFFCWNYAAFLLGWLEDGFMTLENISPFICTVILVTPFMSRRTKDYAYSAIAFLGCGMLLALFLSPLAEYALNLKHEAAFIHISEASCHLIMAIYAFYLILSGKVKVRYRSLGKACVFIYGAVLFGVFLNWYFHVNNFGMNMHGKYSIYWLDIFGSFEVTLIAYLVGIFGTLLLGYGTGAFLIRITTPKQQSSDAEHAPSAEAIGLKEASGTTE